MGLKYFSLLPEELKNKIVQEHLKEERKKQFLERSIEARCKEFEALFKKGDLVFMEVLDLSRFLQGFAEYVEEQLKVKCLIRWKKDVPVSIKCKVMEEQHLQKFAEAGVDDLSCEELLYPDVDDDVTYKDGAVVNCNQLDDLLLDLGEEVVYITVSKSCIRSPLIMSNVVIN
uniref:Cell cycle link protein n=1 Tax=Milk vetch chlorotic dwarf virus TaxID=2683340 RepID=A0A650FYT4_9VIRU|nr:cell cycle link protein [Milk vetch chlorotic dwarf virus]